MRTRLAAGQRLDVSLGEANFLETHFPRHQLHLLFKLSLPGCNQLAHIFLPRDATQSAVMPPYVVRPSVRLTVTFKYRHHKGWNTPKIISRLVSLTYALGRTATSAIWSNWNTPI